MSFCRSCKQEMVETGWASNEAFLAGYGLTQAVPGPLFTFAAYLGAVAGNASSAWSGASSALIAVFLPGLLLVYGMLPFWDTFRSRPAAQYAMRGANAAVMGILGAALYDRSGPALCCLLRASRSRLPGFCC